MAVEVRAPAAASEPVGGADLFQGPYNLRWRTERRALWLTLLFAPLSVALIGLFIPEHIGVQQGALLIVVGMVYVTIARGRLLGTSIRAHEGQLPELHRIVERCARLLRVPMPHVFVREDLFVCITGMGLGQPYSLALSSVWLPHLEEDEIAFLVGSELGHVAAGHTRLSSLFSASGKENPIVALVFGAWLRRTEYTADRIGLLCCGSIDAAIRAIFKCSFHPLASRVSFVAFSDQRRELSVDPGLKMGEWLGESPYAVNRLRELQLFAESPAYGYWRAEFERRRAALEERALPAPEVPWAPKDAGVFRRALAAFIDYIVVSNIIAGVGFLSTPQVQEKFGKGAQATPDVVAQAVNTFLQQHGVAIAVGVDSIGAIAAFFAYSALLVAFTGRTFGMMIIGLRVVRNDLSRVSGARSVWRYIVALFSTMLVFPLLFGLRRGRLLHDWLSGTRVIRGGA